jgi:hypothetical protein
VSTVVEVAALERCCQRAAIKPNNDATPLDIRAVSATRLDGNGLIQRSDEFDPSELSSSEEEYQPRNVPRRQRQEKLTIMLMNLGME